MCGAACCDCVTAVRTMPVCAALTATAGVKMSRRSAVSAITQTTQRHDAEAGGTQQQAREVKVHLNARD
jgi:hypothetical protein